MSKSGPADPRITQYREAAEGMLGGDYRFAAPEPVRDEIDRLGAALANLGTSLEKRFAELSQFSEVTEKVNSGVLLDEVLDHIFESFQGLIPYDRMSFALVEERDPGKRLARCRWGRSKLAKMEIDVGYAEKLEGSSLEEVLQTGTPRIIGDLDRYLAAHPGSRSTKLILKEGLRSSLTCPIIALGNRVGFLFFSSTQIDAYQDVHKQTFFALAGHISIIVEKSRVYERLLDAQYTRDRLLGFVSYDLRNPLMGIRSLASILERETMGQLGDKQRDALKSMVQSCEKILAGANALVDVAEVEQGTLTLNLASTDLRTLLEDIRARNAVLVEEEGLTLILDIPDALPRVQADEARIVSALETLLQSAIKASPENGEIAIRASAEARHVVISVTDQGPEISEDIRARIFRENATGKPEPCDPSQTTGLDLAITRRLIDIHKGEFSVHSEPGQGKTITVSLPRAD